MALIDMDYLSRLEEYFSSGDCEFEFENGEEEKRYEILDFLEKLMDVADQADALATKLIFKGQLDQMLGGGDAPAGQ